VPVRAVSARAPCLPAPEVGREETHTDMGRGVTDEAATVLTLLGQVTPVLCVECLAEITAVPLSTMRATTTDLLEAGRLIMAPELPCPACQKHPALTVERSVLPGESFRLIVVRRDRPETVRNILGAPDRWPPGTAVILDRRVGERRTQSQQATLERRREPRRAEADAMWDTHEFIVVETHRIRHQAAGCISSEASSLGKILAASSDSAAVSLDGTDLTRKHRSHKSQGLPEAPPSTCREA
jgi:hypothetical protein